MLACDVLHIQMCCIGCACSVFECVQASSVFAAYSSCTSNPVCKAFNTDMWLKYHLPTGGYNTLGGELCQGIYVKVSAKGGWLTLKAV